MNKKNSLLLPPQFFETDSDKKIRTILDLGVDALYLFDHFKNPTDSTKPTYIFTEEIFSLYDKVKNEIGDFRMDNLKDEKNDDILGLFQESYNPIGLHVDAGFNLNEIIFKQTLIPLTSKGSTVIFKNR